MNGKLRYELKNPFDKMDFSKHCSDWLPQLDEFANSVTSYDRGRMMILKDIFLELGIEVTDVNAL